MPLTVDQIGDMIIATHKQRENQKFNQIAQRLVDYPFFDYAVKKNRVKMLTGVSILRSLMLSTSAGFRMVGLNQQDVLNIGDVLANAEVPWRHANTPYGYDVKEIMMNEGDTQIIDILKSRRADAQLARVEGMSTRLWSAPTSSSDKLNLWGVPYWVVQNATTGFNGDTPSGFSDVAGVTNANWKNYTAQYATVSKGDLISKCNEAMASTRFKSPIDISDYKRGVTDRYRIFAPRSVIKSVELLQEQQNDSLGADASPMFGKANINRTPMTREPALDATGATDPGYKSPVFLLDMDYWDICFLEGGFERTSKPMPAPNQHDTLVVHIDDTLNLFCTDRRRQSVIATA